MTAEVDAPPSRWAGVGPALEILALWALAGAQPVLDLFGRNAEFFLASAAGPGEIVTFALVVAFAVPLALILLELPFWLLRSRFAVPLHRAILGLLGVVLGLNVARQVGFDGWFGAILLGIGFAALAVYLERKAAARSAMRYLGLAPLAFVALFVFSSEAGRLVFAQDAEVVEVEQGTGGPVAVLVYDELPLASLMTRRGEFNAQRFPNFARLANQSTWYRNATAVAPSTPESVPTILTGENPDAELLPTSADQPVNIFTLLGGKYEVDAFEGLTDLCPDDICEAEEPPPGVDSFVDDLFGTLGDASVVYGHLTLPEPARDSLPTLGQAWAGFLDEPSADVDQGPTSLGGDLPAEGGDVDDRDEISDFLTGLGDAARERGGLGLDLAPVIDEYDGVDGSLFVGHDPFMPHRPWHLTPTGALYDGNVGGVVPGQEEWPDSPAFVRRVLQRHLLQVGFADLLLGRLLDRFEDAGTLDEATIVVVADHGMSFQPGLRARSPNEENVHEIYRVPLLIKAPGQSEGEGRTSDRNALLIDVLPTILDLIDIEVPPEADFDGQSLVDPAFERADDDKPVYYGLGPNRVEGGFEALLPAIFRNVGYVGDGGWVDLLRTGPAGELVNRRFEDVRRERPLEAPWHIDQRTLAQVQDSVFRPIAVSGRIEADEDDDLPSQVLISVDGVLAGLADLDAGDGSFAGLVDERRLTPGPHDIGLFLPEADGRSIRRVIDPEES